MTEPTICSSEIHENGVEYVTAQIKAPEKNARGRINGGHALMFTVRDSGTIAHRYKWSDNGVIFDTNWVHRVDVRMSPEECLAFAKKYIEEEWDGSEDF